MIDTFTRRTALAAALALPLSGLAGAAMAETRSYVLTTATTGGTYYPVGVALATLAKIHLQNEHGIDMSAISSAGSGENTVLMREGQAQFAIMQGLFGQWAREGSGALEDGPQENQENAPIAMLWPNVEHFLIHSSLVETGTAEDLRNLEGRASRSARAIRAPSIRTSSCSRITASTTNPGTWSIRASAPRSTR
jgi:uncharacterized protein